MKITKSQLKQIIKEEFSRALRESDNPYDEPTTNPGGISDEQYDKNVQAARQQAADQTRHIGDEEPQAEKSDVVQIKRILRDETLNAMHIPTTQRGPVIDLIMDIVDIGLDKEGMATYTAIKKYLEGFDAQ